MNNKSNYEVQQAFAERWARELERKVWRVMAWAWFKGMCVRRIHDCIIIEPRTVLR
jgi:hypothetical protein